MTRGVVFAPRRGSNWITPRLEIDYIVSQDRSRSDPTRTRQALGSQESRKAMPSGMRLPFGRFIHRVPSPFRLPAPPYSFPGAPPCKT